MILHGGLYDCPCKVSIHRDVLCMSKPNQTLVCKELCVWYTVHVSVQSLTFVWIRFHTVAQPKLFAREWSAWTAQTHKGGISAIWFLNILVALVAEPCSIFYNGICFITACQSAVQQDILLEAIRRPGAKGVFCRQHWVALMFLPPFWCGALCRTISRCFQSLHVFPGVMLGAGLPCSRWSQQDWAGPLLSSTCFSWNRLSMSCCSCHVMLWECFLSCDIITLCACSFLGP